jgi:hypothetical protein
MKARAIFNVKRSIPAMSNMYMGESSNGLGEGTPVPIRETPIERGRAAALSTEGKRVAAVLEGALADVKRTAHKKSVNQPSRDAYDRAFNRLEIAAQNQANFTGEDVVIPVRDAPVSFPRALHDWAAVVVSVLEKHKIKIPPLPMSALTQIIKPCAPDGRYRESKGLSPDGTGLPLTGPGSNVDPNWSAI